MSLRELTVIGVEKMTPNIDESHSGTEINYPVMRKEKKKCDETGVHRREQYDLPNIL